MSICSACVLPTGIGVPILLAYVYGVVPISLCRSGGCGVTTTNTGGVRFEFDEEAEANAQGNFSGGFASSLVEANVFFLWTCVMIIIMIMYVYHALVNALSFHMIHVTLNMMFCTHACDGRRK